MRNAHTHSHLLSWIPQHHVAPQHLAQHFQLAVVSRRPRSHVEVVIQELQKHGVEVQGVFAGDEVADRAQVPPCMLSLEPVYKHFGVPAYEVSSRVLLVGSINLSHEEIQVMYALPLPPSSHSPVHALAATNPRLYTPYTCAENR